MKFLAKEGGPVYSIARNGLLFGVKTYFDLVLLECEGTSQVMLFVALSAPYRNYKKEEDVLVTKMSRKLTLANSLRPPVSTVSSSK